MSFLTHDTSPAPAMPTSISRSPQSTLQTPTARTRHAEDGDVDSSIGKVLVQKGMVKAGERWFKNLNCMTAEPSAMPNVKGVTEESVSSRVCRKRAVRTYERCRRR
ncbi:hypothetical protein K439DRAFT_406082 [Ramaria rubella]|nr:hypothetical protein K439DRAFT_406082 [Ramaria rubella]